MSVNVVVSMFVSRQQSHNALVESVSQSEAVEQKLNESERPLLTLCVQYMRSSELTLAAVSSAAQPGRPTYDESHLFPKSF